MLILRQALIADLIGLVPILEQNEDGSETLDAKDKGILDLIIAKG